MSLRATPPSLLPLPSPSVLFTLPSVLPARCLPAAIVNGTSLSRRDASTRSEEHTLRYWCSSVLSSLLLFPQSCYSDIEGLESPLRGDEGPIKYLWINIHSNVWQWRNPVTGKLTWLVCAQHAAGEVQSLSSACVSVCVCVCGCVGRWCYCGGHIFRLLAFLLESRSYYLIDQPREMFLAASVQTHINLRKGEQIRSKISPK